MSEKIRENTGIEQEIRDEAGRFLPGVSGNPDGRPKGAENFATKWKKAIEKIADANNTDPDDIERQLLLVGYKKAKDGDYQFYRDIFDRVYGKPQQSIDHTTGGEKIQNSITFVPFDEPTSE